MESHAHGHEGHAHHDHDHGDQGLTPMAISATLHCLFGCALGEIAGMVIGTALGFSNFQTIVTAIVLAFVFGYSLTSLPLLRAGWTLAAAAPIALASDTLSITTMEIVDNAIVLVVPGAMDAGLGDLLFWGALSVALVIAGVFAVPVNRWLLARGKGHAVVHETGIHGGPSPRVLAIAAAVAAVFGTTVLIADASDGEMGGGHGNAMGMTGSHEADPVRGLTSEADGLRLVVERRNVAPRQPAMLSFRIDGKDGAPVHDFETTHEKKMHLIVVRRDLTGFQHLHPKMAADGTWTTRLTLAEAGEYRVFADFQRDGKPQTLASDLTVPGSTEIRRLPAPADEAGAPGGYRVKLTQKGDLLRFAITRNAELVTTEPYLGAGGHLVALREGDLAFLHVHPTGGKPEFEAELARGARYRLFLQFKDEGRVHTAAFTRDLR